VNIDLSQPCVLRLDIFSVGAGRSSLQGSNENPTIHESSIVARTKLTAFQGDTHRKSKDEDLRLVIEIKHLRPAAQSIAIAMPYILASSFPEFEVERASRLSSLARP
jgi:hypothetical protein